MRKLFVGNLALNTVEDDLRVAFELEGLVPKSIALSKDALGKLRGFGFVEFASEEDAAKGRGLKLQVKGRLVRMDYASQ